MPVGPIDGDTMSAQVSHPSRAEEIFAISIDVE